MSTFLLGLVAGAGLAWASTRRRNGYWREFNARRRGSNGNCEPMPLAPPYSSAAIAWQAAEAQRVIDTSARVKRCAELYAKLIDPSIGVPWEEGRSQRGNGHGGPSTPKPPIKPLPSGG